MNMIKSAFSASKIILFRYNSPELPHFIFSYNYTVFLHTEPFWDFWFTKNIKLLDDFTPEFNPARSSK